ncbi:MAG TPA: ABC transporter ATP-binding protein [Candidatus Melainabacteria bacterium]|jgi:ABC-type polysaccharide/polyol phosphate transport system ATPase subunit|nr:ABC transporter ATP-binding protein [Candidatus Melainabacteria bacterium]HIN67538.1 ABC transporter ATP-binding protein [Candidatus Obscuribacterales bacterium]
MSMYSIQLANISKKYNIYDRPTDRLKELLMRNRRSYHREFWALRDISFNVERGDSVALLGPNGSGKSTLLQIVAGVLQPSKGRVAAKGRITSILELGSGFQPDYTGRENVILNGIILGIPEKEIHRRLDEIAEFAEVGDFFDQPIRTYSSGMVVRLAFASMINVDPEILVVDEAMAVGDRRFQLKCLDKIRELRSKGTTLMFVTHEPNMVYKYCQNAVLLNGGQMIMKGPSEEVVPAYEELMSEHGVVAKKVFVAAQ